MTALSEQLNKDHGDLAVKIAKGQFLRDSKGRPFEEWEQDAAIGFWFATETYTPDVGDFVPYAIGRIKRQFRASDREADHLTRREREAVKAGRMRPIPKPVSLAGGMDVSAAPRPGNPDDLLDWLTKQVGEVDAKIIALVLIHGQPVIDVAQTVGLDRFDATRRLQASLDFLQQLGRDVVLEVLA